MKSSVVNSHIECISLKDYQYDIEKFENLSQIRDFFFAILVRTERNCVFLSLSSTMGDLLGSVR